MFEANETLKYLWYRKCAIKKKKKKELHVVRVGTEVARATFALMGVQTLFEVFGNSL